MEKKWRFIKNGHGQVNGLDSPEVETFMKDPYASLAREISQNSIDAHNDKNNDPVKVEFKTFNIKRTSIPDYKAIEKAIEQAQKLWKNSPNELKKILAVKEAFKSDTICCLRISDFNTKGLTGLKDLKNESSAWKGLIHNAGASNKIGSKGGSKGIGKFSSFLVSSLRMVFYSTYSIEGTRGYEGIFRFCSGDIENSDEKTTGLAFYGSDEKNSPIFEELNLDINFSRGNKPGTDVYIIGF